MSKIKLKDGDFEYFREDDEVKETQKEERNKNNVFISPSLILFFSVMIIILAIVFLCLASKITPREATDSFIEIIKVLAGNSDFN